MQKQIIIVGAGMSGLMAAQHFKRAGIDVTVLDKANRPGGRMATRPFEGAIFDYGAQYFTVRSERFASFQRSWETKGLVRLWEPERYIGQSGMNSIAAHLAQGLDLRCGVKVRRIYETENGPSKQWALETDFDEVMVADALIVTCPVPQALAMLDRPIPELDSIAYDRCLTLMAILDAPHEFSIDGERIAWFADNQQKGISMLANSVTINAGPNFSLDNWDLSAEEVAFKILGDVPARAWKLHRWKFAKPIGQHKDTCFELNTATPLFLAGDAFGGPRVEGAAISGLAAAERLLARLSLQP